MSPSFSLTYSLLSSIISPFILSYPTSISIVYLHFTVSCPLILLPFLLLIAFLYSNRLPFVFCYISLFPFLSPFISTFSPLYNFLLSFFLLFHSLYLLPHSSLPFSLLPRSPKDFPSLSLPVLLPSLYLLLHTISPLSPLPKDPFLPTLARHPCLSPCLNFHFP